MNLTRFEPYADVEFFFNRLMPTLRTPSFSPEQGNWSPRADISESDAEFKICAELPAVKKEDVQVTVEDGVITIRGEKKDKKEEKGDKLHRVESYYGSFERRFSLPANVETDAIRCETKDGVLTVHLPKRDSAKAKPRQIAVQ